MPSLPNSWILKHTNSVYLLKSQAVPGAYDLVVYLDNSTCAAELNARRELLRFEYLDRFNTTIDVFEIRISRGPYRDKHPFAERLSSDTQPKERSLSEEETARIEEMTSAIEDPRLRASFQRAMTAQKRRNESSS